MRTRTVVPIALAVFAVLALLTLRPPLRGERSDVPLPSGADRRIVPGVRWQWQLEGVLDTAADAEVFDVDLFDADSMAIAGLHANGRIVICSVSVGTWEDWRPDTNAFSASVIGHAYPEWPGERWLDIRRIDLLAPVLERRFAIAQEKGCDGIEPDNVDGYVHATGFPLTADDQLQFTRWVADAVHRAGMSVGLKNDPDHAAILEPSFDWALVEECAAEGWCDAMRPFLRSGKAVLQAEYTDTGVDFSETCQQWGTLWFSPILKRRSLDAWQRACPVGTRGTPRRVNG